MNDPFCKRLKHATALLRERCDWPMVVCHHNDADGLSSGAILESALEKEGRTLRRICLERLYPQVLKRLFETRGAVLVFADFGGYAAPHLATLNRGRNLVLILDHHPARDVDDPTVINLDADLFGLKGDRDIAAATVCYRFARTLDEAHRDLAALAVVGAVGDRFGVAGRLISENQNALETAICMGDMRVGSASLEMPYEVRRADGQWQPIAELADELDVLGSVGYADQGPSQGVALCRSLAETIPPDPSAVRLREQREGVFEAEIRRLSDGGLQQTRHVQWFDVGERFAPMGVKTVGTFCQRIRTGDWIHPRKYLVGCQPVPDRIPGLGFMDLNTVKVSMRVTPYLEKQIAAGRAPGLDRILPPAARQVGGFADACHSLAAAVTIPSGQQTALVAALDGVLEEMSI